MRPAKPPERADRTGQVSGRLSGVATRLMVRQLHPN
jgi:hypothetical protein